VTALAPGDELPVLLNLLRQLVDEPGFADPRDSHKRDELRRALLAHTRESRDDELELALPPNERCDGSLRDVDPDACVCLHRLPDGDRLALPLRNYRLRFAVVDNVRRRPVGLLTHEHPAHCRTRLNPRSGVHHVAGRHCLAFAGARVDRDKRLAGVHSHADL
jgi:hypothetical protein